MVYFYPMLKLISDTLIICDDYECILLPLSVVLTCTMLKESFHCKVFGTADRPEREN